VAAFVGRSSELAVLRAHLDTVERSGAARFLSVRGRRQVGKSRLIEEFLRSTTTPSAFFTAAKGAPVAGEVASFAAELATSGIESAELFDGVAYNGWEPVLRQLATQITAPTIVVIDELPYLLEADPTLEGSLQRIWDRYLSRAPILLIAIGSDLATMEMLGTYDRPLFGRVREMVIDPFNVAEVADMLGLGPTKAVDAYLAIGGFPTLADSWRRSRSLETFLEAALTDATSPLVVVGERILNAEFPAALQPRDVLLAIGADETTFTSISRRTGINQGSLTRTLPVLVDDKRVVAVDHALSSQPSRSSRYRVADPYLRFWLRYIQPNMDLILRGRGEQLAATISAQWPDYRGEAVEPLVRSAIEQLLPDERFGDTVHVGSFWTRSNDVEVDLVGGASPLPPTPVAFIGSIKWRERRPFGRDDLAQLTNARTRVPGAGGARLVGVSRSGFSTDGLDVALGPDDIVRAWVT